MRAPRARSTIVNTSGVASTYVFTGVDMKKPIDAKRFVFDPKLCSGCKVVAPTP